MVFVSCMIMVMLMITTFATLDGPMIVMVVMAVRVIMVIVPTGDLHFSIQHIEQPQYKQPEPSDRGLNPERAIPT